MQYRFQGFRQLIGAPAFTRVRSSSICVVGLGGVGSWVVEALARSGIGALTLVDLDEVCETNINRQIHALTETVGRSKAAVLANRVASIHPECTVTPVQRFFTEDSADQILAPTFNLVIDTIDTVEHKALLLARCRSAGIPVLTVGSGGDRFDPCAVSVADLARTIHDPLLQCVRKTLRQRYNFPKGERARFNIPCVYAPLQRNTTPRRTACEGAVDDPAAPKRRATCNEGLGSAVFVTGTLGFVAAAEALRIVSGLVEAQEG
jgi:tRNA A37 threonylcarbamoyladenosine dehydratase